MGFGVFSMTRRGSRQKMSIDQVTVVYYNYAASCVSSCEAESREKHGVWDSMPELTITSPYVHSRDDSLTFAMGNPLPESTLTPCRVDFIPLWIWPQTTFLSLVIPWTSSLTMSTVLNMEIYWKGNYFSTCHPNIHRHAVREWPQRK